MINTFRGQLSPLGQAVGRPPSSLLTGLLAWWELDEASGTRNDSHGTSHLTDVNTVGSTTGIGGSGTAADFVKANLEYLTVADNATLSLASDSDVTICGWINLKALTGIHRCFGKGSSNAGSTIEYNIDWEGGATSRFVFYIGNGTTFGFVRANAFGAASIDTWYWLHAEHEAAADTIRIRVNNGTANTSSWTGGTWNGTRSFDIGRDPIFSAYLDGRAARVGVFSRILTSDERAGLYNSGAGLAYPLQY